MSAGPSTGARDVTVVGGSAAGFFVAHVLARRGVNVRVLERADRLDPVVRTLIVTSRMRALLGNLGEKAVVNEIRRFELRSDGHRATVSLRRPDLVIERSALIRSLAEQAVRDGSKLLFGHQVLQLVPSGAGLTLVVERERGGFTEELKAATVVGADGTWSRVALAAGWPPQATVPLVQAVVRLPRDLPPDTTRIWFAPEETSYFYWLIPESPTRGVLGVIGDEGHETRRALVRFLERHDLEPLEFQGARIPVYSGWIPVHHRVGAGDVYLVGDAARHVKMSTIGGVVAGFQGALGVAEAIVDGARASRLTRLRRDLELHLLIRKALDRFSQHDYVRLLNLVKARTTSAFGVYSRDEAARLLISLCLRQPRLFLNGLWRLLVRP